MKLIVEFIFQLCLIPFRCLIKKHIMINIMSSNLDNSLSIIWINRGSGNFYYYHCNDIHPRVLV